MNKTLIKILGPLAVIAFGIGGYSLLNTMKPEPDKKQESRRAMTVFVEAVKASNMDLKVITQGEVRAKTQIDIVAQVAGRVIEVSTEFVEGGIIKPDVPLVSIESIDYVFAVNQGKARVTEAEVRVQQAKADAEVAQYQLRNEGKVSDLALKIPQLAEANAKLKAAQSYLEQARVNLSRTQISLPFDGRVISTSVAVGQYISPGTRIGRAFGNDSVEIRLPLNDSQLATLGLPIGFVATNYNRVPVKISAKVAGREQLWTGQLKRLDASIDPSTRMLFGTAEVKNPYAEGASQTGMPLAVGLFVTVEIVGRTLENAYIISREALRAGDKVYVVNNDGKLEIRSVDVTYSSETEAVVSVGLDIGDQVITSSIPNPIEGMPFSIAHRNLVSFDDKQKDIKTPHTADDDQAAES
ncbi:MAG: efflux RND transporter periplasmic adaptor subunit [Porticoccaceae bacterium]|nr:efflux RND transporter periplasmic adaptor subunit [Porticoccaceae bacterium]